MDIPLPHWLGSVFLRPELGLSSYCWLLSRAQDFLVEFLLPLASVRTQNCLGKFGRQNPTESGLPVASGGLRSSRKLGESFGRCFLSLVCYPKPVFDGFDNDISLTAIGPASTLS